MNIRTIRSDWQRTMPDQRFAFGPFVFDGRGGLSQNGAPVTLSSRGAALLRSLLEADGEAVTKATLMDAAWPNMNVEESNLTVQIAALRKCLSASSGSEDWIATVPRVGYRLARSRVAAGLTALPDLTTEMASIAVLPFTNMSSDPDQEFFADGLAEDLISDLSRVPRLLVIARNSSFTYKGKQVDLRAVARDLNVRYVVEGSVRRAGDRIRVSAQLIDTVDQRHLWVDRFDRDLADVFRLQDEIVGRIVNALADVLPSAKPIAGQRVTNLQAYDFFVRGRALVTQSADGNKQGHPFLERSIKIDPGFSEPYAWLAISHLFGWAFWGEDAEARRRDARKAAERAVALDPSGAGARWILGYVRAYTGELNEGIAELEATLRDNPNHADAWYFLGELRAHQGRALEGIKSAERALRLNPFPPSGYYWALGFAQYAAGRYEDAIQTLNHEAVRQSGSRRILAASLAQVGRLEEAKAEAAQFLTANPHFTIRHWASTQPFQHEIDRQHFVDGYLKAGLPQ